MIVDAALEDAIEEFADNFKKFDKIVFVRCVDIKKGVYKPFCCYAITDGYVVTDFLVTLTLKEGIDGYPPFIYTIYDQSLGKKGIYRFI